MNLLLRNAPAAFFNKFPEWLSAVTQPVYASLLSPRTNKGNEVLKRYEAVRNNTGVFLAFASEPPTEEGLDRLMDVYGRLDDEPVDVIFGEPGAPLTYVFLGPPGPRIGDDDAMLRQLRREGWLRQHRALRRCVLVSQLLWPDPETGKPRGEDQLADLVDWREDGSVWFKDPDPSYPADPDWKETQITSLYTRPELLSHFRPKDRVAPARVYVQSLLNDYLTSPWVRHQALFNPVTGQVEVVLSPYNLQGAIWLQFTEAFQRGSRFADCPVCGTWFEVAPDRTRSDRLYCTRVCRNNAARKRVAEAVRLKAEGKSDAEIAQILNTEVGKVSKWVADEAKKRAERDQNRGGEGGAD
jgi:hypothetical protein